MQKLWSSIKHDMWRRYGRLRRATIHKSVIMNGRPLFRCHREGQLILHQDVRINTTVSSNPVIGRCRSSLSVVHSGAILEVGSRVGMSGVSVTAAQSVYIGEGTILGGDVLITDTDFHLPIEDWAWSNSAYETSAPVVIGRGCFIGVRAMILKGVTLGDGVVVAAGAVVTKNVPSEHLAYGNPIQIKPLPEKWLR